MVTRWVGGLLTWASSVGSSALAPDECAELCTVQRSIWPTSGPEVGRRGDMVRAGWLGASLETGAAGCSRGERKKEPSRPLRDRPVEEGGPRPVAAARILVKR